MPGRHQQAVAGGDQSVEIGTGSEPRDADQGRRDRVRRDSREDTAATGDLAAAHGRAGEIQAVAAAPRVPGPPQGTLQRRQLNERRGAERRPGAAERTGARLASRTLLGQGESDRPGREISRRSRGPGDRKWRRFLGRIREPAQTISIT